MATMVISFVAIFAVFFAVKHVTKAHLCFISSELWNHGNRDCRGRYMNYVLTPSESLIFNYPQLPMFSLSQGFLSYSSAEHQSFIFRRVFAAPLGPQIYCLLRPAIGKLPMYGLLGCLIQTTSLVQTILLHLITNKSHLFEIPAITMLSR